MMKKIILIGAGQLGSRHLQALGLLENKKIWVIDPSKESLELSKERYKEVSDEKDLILLTSIPNESSNFDMAIIATGAKYRFQVLEKLLANHKVTNLLLEKVLFQKKDEYQRAMDLLEAKGVRAWVNCPRRMFPFYQQLKSCIQNNPITKVSIIGESWGLASNFVHYLDLFQFLSGESPLRIQPVGKVEIIPSRHLGHKEILGHFQVKFPSFELSISCSESSTPSLNIEIHTNKEKISIDEIDQSYLFEKEGERKELGNYNVFFQSQLSNLVFEHMQNKEVPLSSYEESVKTHLPMIEFFQDIFEKQSIIEAGEPCPIT